MSDGIFLDRMSSMKKALSQSSRKLSIIGHDCTIEPLTETRTTPKFMEATAGGPVDPPPPRFRPRQPRGSLASTSFATNDAPTGRAAWLKSYLDRQTGVEGRSGA